MIEEFEPPLHEPARDAGWLRPVLIAAVIGVIVLGGGLWYWGKYAPQPVPETPPALPPLDAEAQAYLPQIEFTRLGLSRWQNFLGQTVTYVDFTVNNNGPRTVRALELTFEFMGRTGQVVKTERARVVGNTRAPQGSPTRLPLAPASSVAVRLGFEEIPDNWDQTTPRIRISGLLLGEAMPGVPTSQR
ncbi:MAG TPA: hypothetical protein VNN18_12810 [Candidatus Xenobia bacterium]|nr:hypothetical protein [Candidatus Xenobia bacterium]